LTFSRTATNRVTQPLFTVLETEMTHCLVSDEVIGELSNIYAKTPMAHRVRESRLDPTVLGFNPR
jgi:hypothetical protein